MLRFLLKTFGAGFLGRYIRACAEGKNGPWLKALYWNAVGKKTWIGLALAAACVVGVALDQPGIETFLLGGFGGALVASGLVDKDWRKTVPSELKNSWLYAFLRNAAPDVATALAYYAVMLQVCAPSDAELLAKVGLTCITGQKVLGATSALLAFLGLKAEARVAEPPSPLAPVA